MAYLLAKYCINRPGEFLLGHSVCFAVLKFSWSESLEAALLLRHTPLERYMHCHEGHSIILNTISAAR